MLTKLLPEQISKFWDIIGYAVEQTLPPIAGEHPDRMNRVLSAALSGRVDVWASYTRDGDNLSLEAVVLTKLLYDDISNTNSLLIYCVFGYSKLNGNSWTNGLDILVKYAKSKQCSKLIAYTEFPGIVKIAKNLGADTKNTFISFDISNSFKN